MRKRILPWVLLMPLLAGACVGAESSLQSVEGQRLRVTLVEDYFWPDNVTGTNADGSIYPIDVFPLVTALVVRRADGAALSKDDATISRAAAAAHCSAQGLAPPGPSERFPQNGDEWDGTWAFYPCGPAIQ